MWRFVFGVTFIWIKSIEPNEIVERSNLPGIVACVVVILLKGGGT